jgi:hypothetical protein
MLDTGGRSYCAELAPICCPKSTGARGSREDAAGLADTPLMPLLLVPNAAGWPAWLPCANRLLRAPRLLSRATWLPGTGGSWLEAGAALPSPDCWLPGSAWWLKACPKLPNTVSPGGGWVPKGAIWLPLAVPCWIEASSCAAPYASAVLGCCCSLLLGCSCPCCAASAWLLTHLFVWLPLPLWCRYCRQDSHRAYSQFSLGAPA